MKLSNRIQLRHLRMLMAIDQHRHLGRAAETMSLTQPALSKALRELEESLGVPMFERTTREIVPTPYGAALVRHGRLILGHLARAEDDVMAMARGDLGRVHLGMLAVVAPVFLPGAIARLRESAPDVQLVLREGSLDELVGRLREGELDLALGRLSGRVETRGLHSRALYREPMVLVCAPGHPLAAHPAPRWADAVAHEWVLPPADAPIRMRLEQVLRSEGLPLPAARVLSLSAILNGAVAAGGHALALLPLATARRLSAGGALVQVPLSLELDDAPIGVYWRDDGELAPAARRVLEVLVEEAGRFAQGL